MIFSFCQLLAEVLYLEKIFHQKIFWSLPHCFSIKIIVAFTKKNNLSNSVRMSWQLDLKFLKITLY